MSSTRLPIGWHITLRLEDSRNLVPSMLHRRILARAVLEVGMERGLFLFAVPDTHLHVAAVGTREAMSFLAQAIACSLRFRLDLPVSFEPARVRPITDMAHLENVVPYILGNGRRHENLEDIRCEGTNLPDLLGLRVLGHYTALALRSLLPRLTRHDLMIHLPVDEIRAGTDPAWLADAAAASLALGDLAGHDQDARSAQIAAAHVARELRLSVRQSSQLIGISMRTVVRFRATQPDDRILHAIRLQMGLMEAVAASAQQGGKKSGYR